MLLDLPVYLLLLPFVLLLVVGLQEPVHSVVAFFLLLDLGLNEHDWLEARHPGLLQSDFSAVVVVYEFFRGYLLMA